MVLKIQVVVPVLSASLLFSFYLNSPTIYDEIFASPINSSIFGSNATIILQPTQPFNSSFLGNSTTTSRVVTIPDLQVVNPDGSTDVPYKCTNDAGVKPMCESKVGNVADALRLFNDEDKVCKQNTFSCTAKKCSCEMK